MSALIEAITQVRKRIASHRGPRGLNEQNTKGALIEPLLRALGWDVEDPETVTREYKGKSRDRPVDYALRVLRSPKLFVEAKALGENLSDRKWAGQIIGYASVAGVKWAVLTDGNDYRIFNTHAPVDVERKLFRTVSIANTSDEELISTLELLSRDRLEENLIEALWRIHFVDQQVSAALRELFDNGSDPGLVRLLSKRTEGLTGAEVRSALNRVRIALDFPTATAASVRSDRSPRAGELPQKAAAPHARAAKPGERAGMDLKGLLACGALRAPVQLETVYKGQTLTARIENSGEVSMDGKVYQSLSTAASMARMRVNGSAKPPATNGWSFWKYRTADGALETMESLRARTAAALARRGYVRAY